MSALRHRSVPVWAEIGVGVAAVAGTTYLTLISSFEWMKRPGWIVLSIAVVAVAALYGTVWPSIRTRFLKTKLEKASAGIELGLTAALFGCHDATGLDVRQFSATYMVIRGWGRWAQLKTANAKWFGVHAVTDVKWTKGTGTIGIAWAENRAVFDNLEPVNSAHGQCTAAEWAKASEKARHGMSFEQWRTSRNKYGTIVAACTREGTTLRGIVSVTGPVGHDLGADETQLLNVVNSAAAHIGRELYEK